MIVKEVFMRFNQVQSFDNRSTCMVYQVADQSSFLLNPDTYTIEAAVQRNVAGHQLRLYSRMS